MAKRPVIVELAVEPRLATAAVLESMAAAPEESSFDLPGLDLDPSFSPVPLPKLYETVALGLAAESAAEEDADTEQVAVVDSYIVRGEMEEEEAEALAARDGVIGVFADVAITPMLICPGSPPLGSDADVERLLCVPRLRAAGADGRSVMVAIVDTGINMAYLNSRGKNPTFDAARSWVPQAGLIPGSLPVGHGTMCAYDVCIAAPACTLLDIAVLQSTATGGSSMDGLLSDAVRAYNHLAAIMRAPRRPGESRSLVVNNSWGMFHPSWDFPINHPGNYSDNPRHPFNLIVGTLEGLGADILFAAGNCGADCPDRRCQGVTRAIYGANGHPKVLTVAGVDTTKKRVGYSTQGPGRLERKKPDLCGYTHFSGSRVYAADGGTSAATPVVAGVVAAYRSKKPFQPGNPSVSPQAVRSLFCSTCEDLGAAGWDRDHGWGVVTGCAIADNLRLRDPAPINICALIPSLCGPIRIPIDLCARFPQICGGQPVLPRLDRLAPRPGAEVGGYAMIDLGPDGEALEALEREELVEFIYRLGYEMGAEGAGGPAPGPAPGKAPAKAKCGCGGS